MERLRISAISFLNTAPLMWDFEHASSSACNLRQELSIEYTLPSLCAEALRAGNADIGIIPAITYQTIPDLLVIPDVAIASNGPVQSILLVSKVPLAEIKTVAVDTSSRTSVALLEILFRKGWLASSRVSALPHGAKMASRPKFLPMQPELAAMLQRCDAGLLIGDPALLVDRSQYHVVDLADAWTRATGKPFVFAFWAVRKAVLASPADSPRLAKIFQQSRDHGLQHTNEIARDWAPRVGIAEAAVKTYLQSSIRYRLDAEALEGLNLFFDLSATLGILPAPGPKPLAFCV